MKNVLKQALLAVLLLASGSLWAAESGKCGDFITWTLDDAGNLKLTGRGSIYDYQWGTTDPAPWHSFCEDIKSVTISDGITRIGNLAFKDCIGLERIAIPYSVVNIGEYAFYGCESVANIELPRNLTVIGKCAFSLCSNLKSVEIPSKVTSIGEGAFEECESMESVNIPDGLERIEDWVFCYCHNLKNIEIPSSVTSIGKGAFYYCRKLNSIIIPSNVWSIGEEAFANCTGLESITVDEYNSMYDSRNNCNAIIKTSSNALVFGCKNTVIPNRVTSIESGAFEGSGLTSIVIPNGVASVGPHAFKWSTDLESAIIGANVNTIDYSAFFGCSKLRSIVVDEANQTYDSRDNCNAVIHTKSDMLIIGFKYTIIPGSVVGISHNAFSGSGVTSIVIPNGVEFIGEQAFDGCEYLESVTLGTNVNSVGWLAFFRCKGLKRIELLSTVPPKVNSYDPKALDICDKDTYYTCQLVVPDEAIDVYRRTAPWAYFDHIAGVEDVIADGGVVVTAEGSEIIVNGADVDAEVEVYGVGGALIFRGASHSVAVPAAGIYVVRVAGKAVKVAVTL